MRFLLLLLPLLTPGLLHAQLAADADFDGSKTVDLTDLILFAQAFGSTQARYDLDGGGRVDLADFLRFARLFGREVSDRIFVTSPAGTRHEMRLVPPGVFTMGTTQQAIDRLLAENPNWPRTIFDDERPAHPAYLDAYYIDRFETTNADFLPFLNAVGSAYDADGRLLLDPDGDELQIRRIGFEFELAAPEYATRPIVHVTWHGANAYCAWRAARLPTEAEWEKAARGTDGRTYPWGNAPPDSSRLNFDTVPGRTTDVGSYPTGTSPYGLHDMAGNAYEWCADWYAQGYYARSPAARPPGAKSGDFRAIRGGSWQTAADKARATDREFSLPAAPSFNFGFRCAFHP